MKTKLRSPRGKGILGENGCHLPAAGAVSNGGGAHPVAEMRPHGDKARRIAGIGGHRPGDNSSCGPRGHINFAA